MEEVVITPKLQQVEKLFEWYLEPLDVMDYLKGTMIFDRAGIDITRVKERDDEGRKKRVKIFNEWLCKYSSEYPPVFQEIIEIFKNDERYNFLAAILGDKFLPEFFECLQKVSKVEHLKDILQSLMPHLQKIDAVEVAHHMQQHIPENEREDIEQSTRSVGNTNGVFYLLHKLIFKRPGWIQHFIETIKELGYRVSNDEQCSNMTLADLLEDYCGYFDLGRAVEEQMVIDEESASCSLKSSCMESATNSNSVMDPILKKQHSEITQVDTQLPSSSGAATKCEPELREYQKELCKNADLGENVIICAPTNSGKTMVAAHIIKHHLENGPENPRVVFFTPTGGLAEQQFNKLQNHLLCYRERMTIIHGGMEEKYDNCTKMIFSHDVIVMTPQILLNCLRKDKSIHLLQALTLMIFDECHHTRASHPYCEIMRMHLGTTYLSVTDKLFTIQSGIQPQPSLPHEAVEKKRQIVGLTATLGIGSADDEEEATNNIYMLLGMMDASGGLSMVTKSQNIDELHLHCPEAPEEHIYIEQKYDSFRKGLWEAAKDILNHFNTLNETLNLIPLFTPSTEEITNQFELWCQKLRTAAVGYFDKNTGYSNRSTFGRDATSCADALLALMKVIRMTDNCHPVDAMKILLLFIENHFMQEKEKNTKLENTLYDILNVAKKKLQDCVEETENEMLNRMINLIKTKEHEDKDFRCMVMVSRRLYAECLKSFVERSPLLNCLGCRMYIGVGTKSSSDTRGMSHKKQAEAMEAFRKGDCKVLTCTPDAAGEGIDIANCNLVITVECVSDEIKLVQLKGRARKNNSEVIHIHLKNQADHRDKLPYKKLKMMGKVTNKICKIFREDPNTYKAKLEYGRRRALSKQDEARMRKSNPKRKHHGLTDFLACRKCSTHVCTLDQIVKINGNHHTVNMSYFRYMYTTRVHSKRGDEIRRTGMTQVNRICCAECKEEWGNEVEWKGRLVAILGVKGFKILDGWKNKCHSPSKWANAGLAIRHLTSPEIELLLESLPLKSRDGSGSSTSSGISHE